MTFGCLDVLHGSAAFQKAAGPKTIHWIEGASHVDLYDREQYVGPAVEQLTDFFAEKLHLIV